MNDMHEALSAAKLSTCHDGGEQRAIAVLVVFPSRNLELTQAPYLRSI